VSIAIVSDIHANAEALEAVLEDIRAKRITDIYCLGDVVGYGPNPRECLLRATSFKKTLMGNHEEAVLYYADDFNDKARAAIEWTRAQLNAPDRPKDENYRLWNFLDSMERTAMLAEGAMIVHASPRMPTREYVLPKDAGNAAKMNALFGAQPVPLCFAGHTHFPGVFTEELRYISPTELEGEYRPDGTKALVNVGSVGQPRDGDPRASYVTFDGSKIRFQRVEYDVNTTMAKIRAIDALPEFLAGRLSRGR
jgi:diadenosine tetraphosphatase ApaH/serine/threonine PP2A family protein phosphatase